MLRLTVVLCVAFLCLFAAGSFIIYEVTTSAAKRDAALIIESSRKDAELARRAGILACNKDNVLYVEIKKSIRILAKLVEESAVDVKEFKRLQENIERIVPYDCLEVFPKLEVK